MLYAGYSIKKSIDLLANYKKTLSEKSEVIKMKTRLNTELSLMLKMTEEMIHIIHYQDEISTETLFDLKKNIDNGLLLTSNIENHNDTIAIIDSLISYQSFGLNNIDVYQAKTTIRILSGNSFNDIEELNPMDCDRIMNSINMNRDFNIFSSRARQGKTLTMMKARSNSKATIYALEEKNDLFNSCKANCDRVIKGVLTGSRISNDVFDMMVLTPKISWEVSYTQTGGLSEKSEKAMFRHHIKHLRKNGIFVYTIPYFRLTKDLAFIISKTLENVQVIRTANKELQQIIIMGTKNQIRDPREDVYEMLCNLEYNNIGQEITNKYNLASGGILLPELFRGSVLDESELQSLISNSGLMGSFWSKTAINKDKTSTRPLLPFNMGQIGLVLTSGCLDGVVEEYEGQYHAIKGMVTKVRTNAQSDEGNNEEINIETISNKVQINIITPDGEFIELA